MKVSIPHPFPYQGSKRNIAKDIIPYFPPDVRRLIEPFCGSGAISIAAAVYGLTENLLLNDLNEPLMNLWGEILERPHQLADRYETMWLEQQPDRKGYFYRIRDEFNRTNQPDYLLYLLARIVKGSIRYSSDGRFNQSADNRRSGMKPATMRKNLISTSRLLASRASLSCDDFIDVAIEADAEDLVYMDPPYQGTSFTRDHRYFDGLSYENLVDALAAMAKKDISFIVSYDGMMGEKPYGRTLPDHLSLRHLHIRAGRSSQATLLGERAETVESLYLSPALVERLGAADHGVDIVTKEQQQELALA